MNLSSLTSSESLYDTSVGHFYDPSVGPLYDTSVDGEFCQNDYEGTEELPPLYEEETDITYNSNTKEKAVPNLIFNQIFKNIHVPERWLKEGVKPPNIDAKEIAEEICLNLYDEYDLIPDRIAPSIEEGIFIYYKNQNNNRALIIEVYNNFEIAALVTDETGKGNLYSENIKNRSFATIIEKLTKD